MRVSGRAVSPRVIFLTSPVAFRCVKYSWRTLSTGIPAKPSYCAIKRKIVVIGGGAQCTDMRLASGRSKILSEFLEGDLQHIFAPWPEPGHQSVPHFVIKENEPFFRYWHEGCSNLGFLVGVAKFQKRCTD